MRSFYWQSSILVRTFGNAKSMDNTQLPTFSMAATNVSKSLRVVYT